MLAVELTMDQVPIRVRFRSHGPAILAVAAAGEKTLQPDGFGIVWVERPFDGRTAQEQLREPARQQFLPNTIGPVEQISVRDALVGNGPLDESLRVRLMFNVKK